MRHIAIPVSKTVKSLMWLHLDETEKQAIYVSAQPDDSFILHGEANTLTDMLTSIQDTLITRKANARNLDPGTAEYYNSGISNLKAALKRIEQVRIINATT